MTKTEWTVTFVMHDSDEPDLDAQKLWIIEQMQFFLTEFSVKRGETVVYATLSTITDDREQ